MIRKRRYRRSTIHKCQALENTRSCLACLRAMVPKEYKVLINVFIKVSNLKCVNINVIIPFFGSVIIQLKISIGIPNGWWTRGRLDGSNGAWDNGSSHER